MWGKIKRKRKRKRKKSFLLNPWMWPLKIFCHMLQWNTCTLFFWALIRDCFSTQIHILSYHFKKNMCLLFILRLNNSSNLVVTYILLQRVQRVHMQIYIYIYIFDITWMSWYNPIPTITFCFFFNIYWKFYIWQV